MNIFDKPVIRLLAIVLLSYLVYSNTFHAPFQLDDKTIIVSNPVIRDLRNFFTPAGSQEVRDFFQSKELSNRYVTLLSFALNYRLHGLDVTGYHVLNVAIHTGNALLVYFLLTLTFRTPFLPGAFTNRTKTNLAFVAAVLFACHPLQTGAVTYIWQRATSLAALFCLLSLTLYVKWRLASTLYSGGRSFSKITLLYLLSLISAMLAMKTKQIAFTLPVVIALYEFLFFEGPAKKRVLPLLPFFGTMLIIPLSLLSQTGAAGGALQQMGAMTRDLSEIPRSAYLLTQFRVIVTYIRLLFFPVNQNVDYDYPLYHSLADLPVLFSFIFLASLFCCGTYLLYASRRTAFPDAPWYRLMSFGILFFFTTISVESSIIPIADVIFEHRVYLPSVGFFIAVAAAGGLVVSKGEERIAHLGRVVAYGTALAVLVFSAAAYARNNVWTDSLKLWQDTVRKSPNKARPHNNLAVEYRDRGLLSEAVAEYQTVVKMYPEFFLARFDLGVAYLQQGRAGEAREEFQAAAKLNPAYPATHYYLANAFAAERRFDDAVREYRIALTLAPRSVEARTNLGTLYASQGRLSDAIREFQTALTLSPGNADAHYNLARAYETQRRLPEAINEYQILLKLSPNDAEAHFNLGTDYEQLGRFQDAVLEYEAALRQRPDDADAQRHRESLLKKRSAGRAR